MAAAPTLSTTTTLVVILALACGPLGVPAQPPPTNPALAGQQSPPPPPQPGLQTVGEALDTDKLDVAVSSWVDDINSTGLWWLATFLSVLGSLLSIMGLNLQRFSHRLEAAKPLPLRRRSYRQKPWVVGFVLVAVDVLLDTVSLTFADLSLVSALGALTLLFNAVIAPRFLGEQMSRRDIAGTVCVFCGTVTSIIFANRKTPAYTFDKLIQNLLDPTFFVYTGCVILVLVLGWLSIRRLKNAALAKQMRRSRSQSSQDFGLLGVSRDSDGHATDGGGGADAADTAAGNATDSAHTRLPKLIKPVLHQGELTEFLKHNHALLYAGSAGTAGGQAFSFLKSSMELLKEATMGNDPNLSNPGSWVCLLAGIGMTALQLYFLNEGLRLFDALSIIPVYQASFTLCGILGGFVYFDEAMVDDDARTTWQLLLFLLGTVLSLGGVFLLSKHAPDIGVLGGGREGQWGNPQLGDRLPIAPPEQPEDDVPIGAAFLSRRALANLSSFEEPTVEEAMANIRAELAQLQLDNGVLQSDLAWRNEVLERIEADLAAVQSARAAAAALAAVPPAPVNAGEPVSPALLPTAASPLDTTVAVLPTAFRPSVARRRPTAAVESPQVPPPAAEQASSAAAGAPPSRP